MKCEKCSSPNPPEALFCQSCSANLAGSLTECPKCSTANDPSAKFCLKCGASLARADSAPTARPAEPAVRPDPPKIAPKDEPPGPLGADGKIAAICVWVLSAVGMVIVLTWMSHVDTDCKPFGGSQICLPVPAGNRPTPLWVQLMFVGSGLGFALGGRLWTKR